MRTGRVPIAKQIEIATPHLRTSRPALRPEQIERATDPGGLRDAAHATRSIAQTARTFIGSQHLSAEREAAPREHFSEQPDAVAHHAVHAEVEKLVDRSLVVDRPDVHRQACPVGGLDESFGDDRYRSPPEWHLDAVGTQTWHRARRRDEAR